MKVLVADDDATSRAIVEGALRRLAYDIVLVDNGSAAWDVLCQDGAPRLAVLDWRMPGLDGIDLCRRVRERVTGSYTYIVLITARAEREDAITGLNAGADDFITKPFNVDELQARMAVGERVITLEMALQRSSSYLTQVLANIDSGVLLSDPNDNVVFANQALGRLHGCSAEAAIGKQRTDFLEDHARYFTGPPSVQAAEGAKGKDTETADFEVSTSPRRVLRWTHKAVPLADGMGRLDLFRDVTSEIELARMLTEQALTDSLTHLFNRRGGEAGIAREIARWGRRASSHLSFALLDLDHFKRVNDTHGHEVGDKVLQFFANHVSSSIRRNDLAIRWGGEEVLLVLPDVPLDTAHMLVDRLRDKLARTTQAGIPQVTVSAGVSEIQEGESADQAIKRADAQLYEAKRAGRNCVR